jgi:hypothetical protein
MRLHRFERRSRFSSLIERPVGTARQRRVLGIAGEVQVQTVERAHRDHLAPIVVEIRHERAHPGHGRMKVAVNRTCVSCGLAEIRLAISNHELSTSCS